MNSTYRAVTDMSVINNLFVRYARATVTMSRCTQGQQLTRKCSQLGLRYIKMAFAIQMLGPRMLAATLLLADWAEPLGEGTNWQDL